VYSLTFACVVTFLSRSTSDLHPGNVLVSKDCKFILLDVGMVTQHSASDHRLISDILAAFIRCDGETAAKKMSKTFHGIFLTLCIIYL
jgi:hypothetical protein